MSQCNGLKPHSPLRQSTIDYMTLRGLSARTQKAYLRELDLLSRHYRCPPDRLSAKQLHDYVLSRIESGLTPQSTNLAVAAMRMFYERVIGRPELVRQLALRKTPERLPKSIDEAALGRLIRSTHDLRYRTAIQLAYSGGLRIGEVTALQVGDIDSKRGFIHVRHGKGDRERLVYLPQAQLEVLRRYYRQIHPKPERWLFFGADPAQPVKAATLRKAFNRARGLAGLGTDITFHSLRHSIATHLLERGASRDTVQDILGHRSAESTRVYARTTSAMFKALDHPANHSLR